MNQEGILEVLRAGDSRGAWFLRTSRKQNGVLAILVSGVLLYIWTSRFFSGYALSVTGIDIGVGLLVVFGLAGQEVRTDSVDAWRRVTYSRTGVSQNAIVQALLGSAMIYSMAYFIVINVVHDSVLPTQIVLVLAISTTVILFPTVPLLSSLKKIPILKTSVVVRDTGSGALVLERLAISILDIAWAGKEGDDELVLSILDRFHDLVANHGELLTSAGSDSTLAA